MAVHRVLALIGEGHEQARLRGAIRGAGVLLPCRSANDVLVELSRDHNAVAVVVSTYGGVVSEAIGLTRSLRAWHPSVPVLVYFDPAHTNPRDLMDFFEAGAAEVLHSGSDDMRRVFAAILARAGHRVKARRALEQLAPIVAPEAKPILQYLIEKGDTPLTIDQAAAAVGLARRTLEKRLLALGYPPPETLIGWCRLLIAAQLLEDQGRTFDDVALQLDFPSGMALRSMLKRYTGVSGRLARAGSGPVALVLRHLTARLRTPRKSATPRRHATSRRSRTPPRGKT